jgi:hypothetical protein
MPDFFDRLADELVRSATPATAPVGRLRRGPGRIARITTWTPRRRKLRFVAVAAAVLAAAGVIAAAIAVTGPSPAPARIGGSHAAPRSIAMMPVAFRTTESGNIVATVTDPYAAQSALNKAFQAAGLNIIVNLVPVSPSMVGTVISVSQPVDEPDGHIEAIQQGTCIIPANGCPIGVTVPRGFTGAGFITLGRPAQPNETYASTNSAFAPGEDLHCSGLLNEQVAAAIPQIQADNIMAEWWHEDPTDNFTNGVPASGSDYIVGAVPVAPGVVLFQTRPTALSAAEIARDQYNHGC